MLRSLFSKNCIKILDESSGGSIISQRGTATPEEVRQPIIWQPLIFMGSLTLLPCTRQHVHAVEVGTEIDMNCLKRVRYSADATLFLNLIAQ